MCEKFRKECIEPMKGTEFPDISRVGVDFFQHKDKHYLLAVDYYSRDVEICLVSKNVNTAQTVFELKYCADCCEDEKDLQQTWNSRHPVY